MQTEKYNNLPQDGNAKVIEYYDIVNQLQHLQKRYKELQIELGMSLYTKSKEYRKEYYENKKLESQELINCDNCNKAVKKYCLKAHKLSAKCVNFNKI